MADGPVPVVLELAPLPRDQLGPYLLLGIEKDADREQIEAAWAARLIAARKNQVIVSLEDINWAREVINDPDRRRRAEVTSLNLDTTEGVLRRLAERYGVARGAAPLWPARDVEKPLEDYTPAADVPRADEIKETIAVPEMPGDLPAVAWLLEKLSAETLDPWNLQLTPDPAKDKQP